MEIIHQFHDRDIPTLAWKIHQHINTDPNLTQRTIQTITASLTKELTYVGFDKNKVAGFITSKPVRGQYIELQSLFVLPHYRVQGLGSDLITAATQNTQIIYLVSTNQPLVISLLTKAGFRLINYNDLPLSVRWHYLTHKSITSIVKHFFSHRYSVMMKHGDDNSA